MTKERSKIRLTNKLMQRLLHPYGMKLISTTPVTGGVENVSSFVKTDHGKFVLRVYGQSNKTLKCIQRELDFMSFLYENGIPLPEIISNKCGQLVTIHQDGKKAWLYILMEQVQGRHLKPTDYNLIPDLARFQARMHKNAVQFSRGKKIPGSFIKGLLSYFVSETRSAKKRIEKTQFWVDIESITKDVISDIRKNLKALENLPTGPVHLDYDSDNIIVTKNKVEGIIDFDDLSDLPFVVDLANTLWWWAYMNRSRNYKEVISFYLNYYQQERPLTRNELSFISLFMRLRNIWVGIVSDVNRAKSINPQESKQIIKFDKVLQASVIG